MILSRKVGCMVSMGITYIIAMMSCLILMTNPSRIPLLIITFILRGACMGASCATWVVTPQVYAPAIRVTSHGFFFSLSRMAAIIATLWPEGTDIKVILFAYACANGTAGLLSLYAHGMLGEEQDKATTV